MFTKEPVPNEQNESKYYASGPFVTSYIDDLSKWTCELYK